MFREDFQIVSRLCALSLLVAMVSACTPATEGARYSDPYEVQNRSMHRLNVQVDRALLRPASQAYSIIPAPVKQGIVNFSDNFETPEKMVNSLLQGDVENLVGHTFRFVLNSTIGIGGLLDVADGIGVRAEDTDFGETLHVWGLREGAYLELPFYGPSTERDATGIVVDFALNPLGYILPSPEKSIGTATKIASIIGDRGRYSEIVDSILYESADGYAQARQIYLDNRRFELGQEVEDDTIDLYEDPYAVQP